MARGVNTNTLVMVGGLGLLGLGMFYMMHKQQGAIASLTQQQQQSAASATQQLASQLNVQSPSQMDAMYQQLLGALSKAGGDMDKALRDQQLISGWVNMGVGAATQIAGAIGSLASAFA